MQLAHIFNILAAKGQLPRQYNDDTRLMYFHGMKREESGRFVALPRRVEDMDLFEDVAKTRRLEAHNAKLMLPDPSLFTDTITHTRALKVFDKLAAMKNIAFGYANDGCYARAHLMCSRLFDMRIIPEKAWGIKDKKKLHVNFPDGRKVKWDYHVAPVVSVRMPDNTVEKMVFDPGLFDGPVTLKEWHKLIHAACSEICPYGTSPTGTMNAYGMTAPLHPDVDITAHHVMAQYSRKSPSQQPAQHFKSQFRQQQSQLQMQQSQMKN